jgi:hypothetical protein
MSTPLIPRRLIDNLQRRLRVTLNEADIAEEFLRAHWRLGHYGDEALKFGILLISFLKNELAGSSKSAVQHYYMDQSD